MNIPENEFENAEPWKMPALSASRVPLRLVDLDTLEQAARAEGFSRGHADGYAAGVSEARRVAAQIGGLLDSLSRPLAQLDSEVEAVLGELAAHIAGELVSQAYQNDPKLLAHLVEQAIGMLGTEPREIDIRLHPDDLKALGPLLELPARTKLNSDTSLARGDLRVNTDGLRLDATISARLQAAAVAWHRASSEQ